MPKQGLEVTLGRSVDPIGKKFAQAQQANLLEKVKTPTDKMMAKPKPRRVPTGGRLWKGKVTVRCVFVLVRRVCGAIWEGGVGKWWKRSMSLLSAVMKHHEKLNDCLA